MLSFRHSITTSETGTQVPSSGRASSGLPRCASEKQTAGLRHLTNKIRNLAAQAQTQPTNNSDVPLSSTALSAQDTEVLNKQLVDKELAQYISDGPVDGEDLSNLDLCRYWQVRYSSKLCYP